MSDGAEFPHEPDAAKRGSFLRAALLTYGTNATVSMLSLANVLIVSRVLGPSARGQVAFLITVSTITGLLAGLGAQEANANIGGSEPRLRGKLATNSILLAAACGALAGLAVELLVAGVPAVGGPVSSSLRALALIAVPLVILKTSLSFLLQSEYAFRITNLAWLIGPTTGVSVNGFLALAGWLSVSAAFSTWIAGQTIGVLILLWYVRRHSGFDRPDAALARRTLSFGLKTHGGRLMGIGNYRADQWLVGSISGSRELGLYSVAVAWADLLFYLPGVLTLVQRPDLVRATRREAADRAARVFRVALLLTMPAALGLIVLAPFLCTIVFGEAFKGSVDDLRILALGAVGIVAIDLLPNALTAQRMPIRATGGIAVAFVVMLALDVVLIPPYGGAGAAAATAIAYTVGGAAAVAIFARALATPIGNLLPRPAEVPEFVRGLRSRVSR